MGGQQRTRPVTALLALAMGVVTLSGTPGIAETPARTIRLPGSDGRAIVEFDSIRRNILVATDLSSNSILAVNTHGDVVSTISDEPGVTGMLVEGNRLYVIAERADALDVIDLTTMLRLKRVPLGLGEDGFAYGSPISVAGRLWFCGANGGSSWLASIDPEGDGGVRSHQWWQGPFPHSCPMLLKSRTANEFYAATADLVRYDATGYDPTPKATRWIGSAPSDLGFAHNADVLLAGIGTFDPRTLAPTGSPPFGEGAFDSTRTPDRLYAAGAWGGVRVFEPGASTDRYRVTIPWGDDIVAPTLRFGLDLSVVVFVSRHYVHPLYESTLHILPAFSAVIAPYASVIEAGGCPPKAAQARRCAATSSADRLTGAISVEVAQFPRSPADIELTLDGVTRSAGFRAALPARSNARGTKIVAAFHVDDAVIESTGSARPHPQARIEAIVDVDLRECACSHRASVVIVDGLRPGRVRGRMMLVELVVPNADGVARRDPVRAFIRVSSGSDLVPTQTVAAFTGSLDYVSVGPA